MTIWTGSFWKAAAERAAKTAGQSALLAIGADQVSAWTLNYMDVAGFALGGAVLSVLTSVASSGIGSDGPSLAGEMLTAKVEAKTDEESPTGAVAGEASPLPEGQPVDVVPAYEDPDSTQYGIYRH